MILFRDLDILIGAILGTLFALKNRKPNQPPLKSGIILGLTGGSLVAFAPAIYFVVYFRLDIGWFPAYLLYLLITGVTLGLIIGALGGWYYMNKQVKEKEDDKYDDDFFKDLIEK
ncbi:MAG: hypothetical protein ACFFBF_12650 [Promethearchaeota archaeon]